MSDTDNEHELVELPSFAAQLRGPQGGSAAPAGPNLRESLGVRLHPEQSRRAPTFPVPLVGDKH